MLPCRRKFHVIGVCVPKDTKEWLIFIRFVNLILFFISFVRINSFTISSKRIVLLCDLNAVDVQILDSGGVRKDTNNPSGAEICHKLSSNVIWSINFKINN